METAKHRHERLAHKAAKRVAKSKNKTRTIRTCLRHLYLSI